MRKSLFKQKPKESEPIPEPAITAILAAFDEYEVVAKPEPTR
jgi:hypothetical protein